MDRLEFLFREGVAHGEQQRAHVLVEGGGKFDGERLHAQREVDHFDFFAVLGFLDPVIDRVEVTADRIVVKKSHTVPFAGAIRPQVKTGVTTEQSDAVTVRHPRGRHGVASRSIASWKRSYRNAALITPPSGYFFWKRSRRVFAAPCVGHGWVRRSNSRASLNQRSTRAIRN